MGSSRKLCNLFCLFVVGCGWGQPMPTAVPVAGIVTLNGAPLPGALVTFDSDDRSAQAILVGITDETGRFTARTATTQTSAYQGKYRVTISKMTNPDGSSITPEELPGNPMAVESLPARYSNLAETKLEATIPQGGGEFKFELTAP